MALEVDPPRRHHLAGVEEVLERAFALVPVPHLTRRRRAPREAGVARPDRALVADELERVGDQRRVLLEDPLHRAPRSVEVRHPPAQQRMRLDRDERRLVSPVLDQPAVEAPPRVPGEPIQHRWVIRPQTREDRHVVRSQEDVDRIELQQPEPAYQPGDACGVGLWAAGTGARATEPLGAQRDPPSRERAQPCHGPGCGGGANWSRRPRGGSGEGPHAARTAVRARR